MQYQSNCVYICRFRILLRFENAVLPYAPQPQRALIPLILQECVRVYSFVVLRKVAQKLILTTYI